MVDDEWINCRLVDACSSIDYGLTASAEDAEGHPRFLRITDIVPGFIDWNTVPHVSIDSKTLEKYRLDDGDIVLARTGASTGASSYIKAPPVAVFASYLVRLKANPKFDSRFLAYYLQSAAFWSYIRGVLGDKSAQPNASASTMAQAPLRAPRSKDYQRAIANILGTLDDKIELNRRVNETLTVMARTLFRSWFIDFDPVRAKVEGRDTNLSTHLNDLFPSKFTDFSLGEIPAGWENQRLREIADIFSGGTPKKGTAIYWTGSIPWISPKSMDSIHVDESENNVTPAAIGNGTRLVKKGSVLVMVRGMGLHQGVRIAQCQRDVAFNQDVKALVPKWGDGAFLLFALLDAAPYLFSKVSAAGHGTGVLATDILEDLAFVVPPPSTRERLVKPLSDLNSKIASNNQQSKNLTSLRNALLPKLLSGQLQIRDAKKFIEEVEK
jgi:type I restriction enzyme, S subunit